jgi:NAD(P)-dependent dehydrogenase (short-subunit alcohol dehydrogenase family)
LAAAGWTVVGASRRGTSGAGWKGLVMDVDDDASVPAGVAQVLAEHGRIDAVVTAAGLGLSGPVETTPLADARAHIETNFWGTVRVVREVLPQMRAAGAGRVVLIGSLAGMVGLPFQAYYSAGKYALEGFGEALAYEVSPFGIEVTLVEPGNTATGFTDGRRRCDPDPDSPYAPVNSRAVAVMEDDERNGIPASRVAGAVERVLASRRPPRRVSVGSADERLGTFAKRFMPHRLFERLARGTLGV